MHPDLYDVLYRQQLAEVEQRAEHRRVARERAEEQAVGAGRHGRPTRPARHPALRSLTALLHRPAHRAGPRPA
ncbi:hypothetical protein ATJ88_2344 [Isoptericola jiangsuensis]|uniref:Uncharacterized protein n=1 Tax=Isoptericola jiangsuensis TaxID=548579 RepID=A0A2A9EXM5_9MICO|nr:hypothetical protein [Isoptericola jiangsuensis]PFG43638.1 hypothetical protein ATJ88_2344 [Isoptericola jiangsuensis]